MYEDSVNGTGSAMAGADIGFGDVLMVWLVAWFGNLAGVIVLASLFHLASGVVLGDGSSEFFSAVQAKMSAGALPLFARGVLCNWLVCLAIWMAARTDDAAAKIMLIFWPITIFVASGFGDCVANMFTFSLALIGVHPAEVSILGVAHKMVWVTLGNLVGGLVFMALGYWVKFYGSGHVSFVPRTVQLQTRARAARNAQ